MIGQCLCGEIAFEVVGPLPNIYQCHCSQCRKVTGSSSNSSLLVAQEQFNWLRGSERITSYVDPSGYRSDFCPRCGIPVPNPFHGKPLFWVPAGLLESDARIEIAAHIFVGSKASWDSISANGVQFQEMPVFENLLEILRPK